MPQVVLYNSNSADNYVFATLASSLHSSFWWERRGPDPSAPQFGPAWWFLDQKQGIIDQLNCLSKVGLPSEFIGVTPDSRSFLSFPRHEYFAEFICDLVGAEVERGELPNHDERLGGLIGRFCYYNAARFFRLEPTPRGLMM